MKNFEISYLFSEVVTSYEAIASVDNLPAHSVSFAITNKAGEYSFFVAGCYGGDLDASNVALKSVSSALRGLVSVARYNNDFEQISETIGVDFSTASRSVINKYLRGNTLVIADSNGRVAKVIESDVTFNNTAFALKARIVSENGTKRGHVLCGKLNSSDFRTALHRHSLVTLAQCRVFSVARENYENIAKGTNNALSALMRDNSCDAMGDVTPDTPDTTKAKK